MKEVPGAAEHMEEADAHSNMVGLVVDRELNAAQTRGLVAIEGWAARGWMKEEDSAEERSAGGDRELAGGESMAGQ